MIECLRNSSIQNEIGWKWSREKQQKVFHVYQINKKICNTMEEWIMHIDVQKFCGKENLWTTDLDKRFSLVGLLWSRHWHEISDKKTVVLCFHAGEPWLEFSGVNVLKFHEQWAITQCLYIGASLDTFERPCSLILSKIFLVALIVFIVNVNAWNY